MQAFSLWLLRLVTGVAVVVYVVLRYLVLGQKLLHAEVGQLRMLPCCLDVNLKVWDVEMIFVAGCGSELNGDSLKHTLGAFQ